ncbi:MAG: Xaa-Pro peptidase family protein [Candidatus Omnitrophica bacterium]|nr:Xaa-Pro peptidase family protein [Candidatus Omnitrophota bacterium]
MDSARIIKLKNSLKAKGADSFWVTDPVNIYYLVGFKTDVSSLVITPDSNFIITDFRYKQDAEEIVGFQTILIKKGLKDTLRGVLKDCGVKTLGFEADHLSYSAGERFAKFLNAEKIKFTPLTFLVEELRNIKDAGEIAEIKKAILAAKKALLSLKKAIRPGITEKRLSALLDNLVRTSGGDNNAFETIMAAGENSSRPHASVTGRSLQRNGHVMIDFGVRLNCYNCDLTRVFFLGRIQKILRDIYAACIEAQDRAIRQVKPGASIRALDEAARGYIAKKGWGENFGHSLGHGVGLSIHELPRIYGKSEELLRPGMVFTVEPGIYIEGVGGVRIEDMVLVTEKGCEVLTDDIPK